MAKQYATDPIARRAFWRALDKGEADFLDKDRFGPVILRELDETMRGPNPPDIDFGEFAPAEFRGGETAYFANWNPKQFARDGKPAIPTRESRWGEALEALGERNLEWSDKYTRCEDCSGFVQTGPDCHDWLPKFKIFGDCGLVCQDCIESDLDSLEELLAP